MNRFWLIIIAISFFLLLAINFAYFLGFKSLSVVSPAQIKMVNAVADFSNYSFFKNSKLKGETYFYWEKLLSPAHFQDSVPIPDAIAQIPGIWNNIEVRGKKIGSNGYGTYFFKIITPDNELYAITIKEFDCAYRLWANNEEVTAGTIGTNKKEMKPNWKRNTIYFQPINNEVRVIIQVSNFHHRKGGAEDMMVFGRSEKIIYYKYAQLGITLLLFGVLLVMFMYHLLLFINRQNDLSLILFSAICLVFSIRLLTTGEKLIFELFPDFNWYLAIKLEYLSYKLAAPLSLGFIYVFYPNEVSKRILKGLILLTSLFCLLVIFSPVMVFSYTPVYFQLIIIATAIYSLFVLFKAMLHKRPQSFLFFFGFFTFILIVINDILYYNKMADTDFLFPFGIFILTFTQATVISLKSSQAFREAELYKAELEEYNKSLEKKVRKRTVQIENANLELEKQAKELQEVNKQLNELNQFKENMTGMIVHDLKNPLNIVLNYSNEEKVLFAARQMLNLVHNILDVQRHEQSEMIIERKPISVKKLVGHALVQVGYLFTERNINLDNSSHDNIIVEVDHNIMVRVLVNLLSNAVKYSPRQGTIGIFSEMDGTKVKIEVSDQGPGISEDKRKIIFQKFGQVTKQKTGEMESTGLGLAFCKMAVEAHHGTIGFDSEEGKGSTFWFTIEAREEKRKTKSNTHLFEESNTRLAQPKDNLTPGDRETLRPVIKELENLRVYEVTKIKSELNILLKISTPGISLWLEKMNQVIWTGDQEGYKRLLALAKQESIG